MKPDRAYLLHIMECVRRVEENTSEGREHFLRTHTLQDAVLRNLQTMSEATQRLSEELKEKHSDVDWRRIAAFRNVLVHDYLGIDLERVWQITQQDLQHLKRAIAVALEGADQGESPGQ